MTGETKKIDEYTIEVTKIEPAKEVKFKYDLLYLLHQREAIQNDIARFMAERQKELDEVNALIAECEKLGIKPKVEKEID